MEQSVFQEVVANAPKKSNLESTMKNFVETQTRQNKDFKNQNLLTNEVLRQLSTKFLKDILSKKRKLEDNEIMDPIVECSTLI